jgi:transaldolase
MRIFLDTANANEIEKGVAAGCVQGVTTNPSIIAREKKPFRQCVADIVAVDPGLTLLMEVVSMDTERQVADARELAALAANAVIKLPMTPNGLAAARTLSTEGIRTTITLVFSLNQAIAASNAGADYVAPFVGRLDDIDAGGLGLVHSIKQTFSVQGVSTQVIAASIRTPQSVGELFTAGCDVVTMPYSVLEKMLLHPLTDAGLKKFEEDWKTVPG